MFRSLIRKEIEKVVSSRGGQAVGAVFSVERPENPEHGDYSSNVALVVAKSEKKNSREVAEDFKQMLLRRPTSKSEKTSDVLKFVEQIEIAGPGFLNFCIKKEALFAALLSSTLPGKTSDVCGFQHLMLRRAKFSQAARRVNLEFVSANPTGPLTMANGRGGFYGDALANILKAAGHKVTREYYINDAGNQIKLLGESILAAEGKISAKEEYYKGDYIKKLKGKSAKRAVGILLGEIKKSLKKAGIKFDVWFSEENNLRKRGELKKVLEFLVKNGAAKEKEGALWWDERVVVKSNGEPTYLLSDLAYHLNKLLKRKFDVAVTVVGADHHAEIKQVAEKIGFFGVDQNRLKIIIMQLVRLTSGGKEVRMSKRAGEFVTLDDLLKEVGLDAARWFFLERSPDTHMDFDLDLAKERSKNNPVYYVQYAAARCYSILRKSEIRNPKSEKGKDALSHSPPLITKERWKGGEVNLQLLSKPEELSLIKKILQLPDIIEDIANDYQVHRLPRYAYELAKTFTDFYEKHRVVDSKNPELTEVRLFLIHHTLYAIRHTLNLMGIAAPEKM